ncbi:Zinc/iron permease [Cunninghamella echinulata]|nr:Zinc/iron permease [Cunninghamella echinulata]
MNDTDNTTEGWIMVSISSIACVFGASIVFIDKLLYKRYGSILSNKEFLASSMALASGVLIIASLSSLLPESQRRLNSTLQAYGWFFCGTIITFLLTRIIHWCTPDAIHACGSTSPIHDHDHHHHSSHSHTHTHHTLPSPSNSSSSSAAVEPLIPSTHQHNSITSSTLHKNHHHHHHHHHHNSDNRENEQEEDSVGIDNEHQKLIDANQRSSSPYGSTNTTHKLPDAHFRFHEHTHNPISHDHEELHIHTDHHHQKDHLFHLGDDKQQFLTIGIQTAIAICVHKFPEGLIMFISSQASSSLSISIAAAMSIHNITEGFMLVLPLYYATGSRLGSFLYAATMGGLSQPLGALIGVLAFSSVSKEQVDTLFGITFGIISGMMTFITIQSMLPQAIKLDDNHNRVVGFFFIGVFLIALSSALKSLPQ